jgi:hypothetical protein
MQGVGRRRLQTWSQLSFHAHVCMLICLHSQLSWHMDALRKSHYVSLKMKPTVSETEYMDIAFGNVPTKRISLSHVHTVTLQNGFELVHGFSYEFRNIQCLQYSATQNSCSSIHHQINLIFPHPNNTTITHTHSPCQPLCAISYTLSLEHMD